MEYTNLLPYFVAFSTMSLGTFLGVLGNKLVTERFKTNFKWAFIILGVVSILSGVLFFYFYRQSFDIIGYIFASIVIVSGILILFFTYKFLNIKNVYKTKELGPIINLWTKNADHSVIKLFGGDLSFFGDPRSDMNENTQYTVLKGENFRRVLILCEEPKNDDTKIRYGKIVHEIRGTELKFYEPDKADLQIRGRLKTVNAVDKLLVYLRIDSGKYQTIDTDTANSSGALYNNIWNLTWSLAKEPSKDDLGEYVQLYKKQ